MRGRVTRSEWRWVLIWIVVALIVTSVPYLVGWLRSTPDRVFGGFAFAIEDGYAYLSKMRQGAQGPGWLVLSEVIAPDWVATIDGERADLLPTDLTLRGMYVPWGTHTVELTYQPKCVYAGMLPSFFSLIVCGAAIAFASFKRDRRRTWESLRI